MFSDDGRLKIIDLGSAEVVDIKTNGNIFQEYLSIKKKYKNQQENFQNKMNQQFDMMQSFIGTTNFLSPEMINKNDSYFSSDFWALGVILYRITCGKYPFENQGTFFVFQKINNCQVEFPEEIDEDLKNLIKQLLELDPKK